MFCNNKRRAYEESLRDYRDLKNILATAYQAGREEGCRIARELLPLMDNQGIAEITDLSLEQIQLRVKQLPGTMLLRIKRLY